MRAGFSRTELLLVVALGVAAAVIGLSMKDISKQRAEMVVAISKLEKLGGELVSYTRDSGGLLPYEDSPGTDGWEVAAQAERDEVWYNALPRRMGAGGVGDLAETPEVFYAEDHPLSIPGAPYPLGDEKLVRPYFAVAMNSVLQRRDETGAKEQGLLSSILEPARTVAFLERGMPGDDRVNKAQGGFSARPKAKPEAFASRHNQRGILVFLDGHAEVRTVSDIIDEEGQIKFPQDDVVWTPDPDDDPN